MNPHVRPWTSLLSLLAALVLLPGCLPSAGLFDSGPEPLKEYVLEGERGPGKVLLVRVRGVITSDPDEGLLRRRPGLLHEVAARLKKAEADPEVKALVLAIDSPGGTVADSDALKREIDRFRERKNEPQPIGPPAVVAHLGRVGASGGYYAALAADEIMVHPSGLCGSVGTIFLRPKVAGLMDKLGLEVETYASGRLKDMGSPFRQTNPEEAGLFREMVAELNGRFLEAVRERRKLSDQQMEIVVTARIFAAGQAVAVGLADGTGFLDEALASAKRRAGLPEDAKVVTYRRAKYPDDTVYNAVSAEGPAEITVNARQVEGPGRAVTELASALGEIVPLKAGAWWLWAPEIAR